jgi:hypothetical protein
MKNTILLIVAVTAMANISYAQENETDFRDKLQFGLKVGANYSNVYDAKGEDFNADPKFGLATGGFVAIPIGTYIGIQPEVLYSQKGFQATGSILGSTYKFTRTTSYIDVPIFFSFKPSEFLTLQAGPQFSYLIKQKDSFTSSPTSYDQEQEFKTDNIRKNTLCFVLGVDINLRHIVLGARAGWDVQNNNGNGTSTTPRYKNVWYQATIGFRF